MFKTDCLHFKGDKPCRFRRPCQGCADFEPLGEKILIIKCRAQGDVLRTTPLLPALKRKYPQSAISWLVDEESVELLLYNPFLHRIHAHNLEGIQPLFVQEFDVLICLDKEPGLTALATRIPSPRKYGFGMDGAGSLIPFNKASDYAYRLGMDDDLKFFRNQKTYQEIIHEAAELEFRNDEYVFELPEEYRKGAGDYFKKNKVPAGKLAVGLNTGAGTKFETKQWPEGHFLRLIHLLKTKLKAEVFLLGGPRERAINRSLEKKSPHKIFNTGNDNSLLEFSGFLSLLDIIVTSDTLGMHLAIALKKKVIALFGPTCPQEIELYGRGTKIFKAVSCAPCYKQTCPNLRCMSAISPDEVFEEIKKIA